MAYVRIRERLLKATFNLIEQHPDYQIVFVGHSLGGALATLAAVDFQDRYGYGDRISIYTFGSPRVGNPGWARYVDSLPFGNRMYRIVHRGDPVAHLPPNFLGYEHSSQMYSILQNGEYIKCSMKPGTGESPDCLDDWFDLNPIRHTGYFGKNLPNHGC
jgi:pimeloyl-ACP methyl ester carboxylesterase